MHAVVIVMLLSYVNVLCKLCYSYANEPHEFGIDTELNLSETLQ